MKYGKLAKDLLRFVPTADRVTLRLILSTTFHEPGFVTCGLLRIMEYLQLRRRTRLARLVHHLNLRWTGADLVQGCDIGPGLLIRHPNGIVIGSDVIIGENCTILQQVTIGASDAALHGSQPYPVIGANVLLGAGCKIIGAVRIGDGVIVGANSVVTRDVPAGQTVVGAPARPV